MYKRKVDSEKFYDRRESIGSTMLMTTTPTGTALGNEVNGSGCNEDGSTSPDHYNPTLRVLQIPRSSNGSLGFHLTRSKWDPYPWVSAVDVNTPAKYSGLKAGDCVLEVNGEDVLGMRISEIAKLVKTEAGDSVSLLLWSAGCDTNCNPESLCCGPMPLNLERLSACTQTVLTIIECPVCLDTIAPPAMQCQNGHILCVKCRILSHTCPVCRTRFYPGRSLIAEQIYNSITDTFNLRNQDKLREKLFGAKYKRSPAKDEQRRHEKQQHNGSISSSTMTTTTSNSSISSLKPRLEVNKFEVQHHPPLPTNKFLAKLLGKAYSMDNLSMNTSRLPSSPVSMKSATNQPNGTVSTGGGEIKEDNNDDDYNGDDKGNSYSVNDNFDEQSEVGNLLTLGYRLRPSTISKQFSLSAHDLSKKDNDGLIANERRPSMNRLQYLRSKRNSLQSQNQMMLLATAPPLHSTTEELLLNGKRWCSPSIEYVANMIQRETLQPQAIVCPPVPRIPLSCCMVKQCDNIFYYCPFNCGNRFTVSTLQQHVKVDHCAPLLCYGSSSAELSLPLRAPLDGASVLLMCDGKDFWIKLGTHGEGSITASALLQGPKDESSDFMMETRLRNRIAEDQDDNGGDGDGVVVVVVNNNNNDDVDDGILERELITRSIVRSMMVTTWEDTNPPNSSSSATEKPNGVLYNRENIRMTFGEAIDYRNLLLKIIIIKRRVQHQETAASENGKNLIVS